MFRHSRVDARLLALAGQVEISTGAAAPTDGTSGTRAGSSGPGSIYICIDDTELYINTRTKANPAWTKITRAVGSSASPSASPSASASQSPSSSSSRSASPSGSSSPSGSASPSASVSPS